MKVSFLISQYSNIANADYKFGSSVSLKNYTSSANAYTFPSDGYLRFSNGLSSSGYADIRLIGLDSIFFLYAPHMGGYETRSVFVRKGMKMYIQHCDFNSNWNLSFNPIIPQ